MSIWDHPSVVEHKKYMLNHIGCDDLLPVCLDGEWRVANGLFVPMSIENTGDCTLMPARPFSGRKFAEKDLSMYGGVWWGDTEVASTGVGPKATCIYVPDPHMPSRRLWDDDERMVTSDDAHRSTHILTKICLDLGVHRIGYIEVGYQNARKYVYEFVYDIRAETNDWRECACCNGQIEIGFFGSRCNACNIEYGKKDELCPSN